MSLYPSIRVEGGLLGPDVLDQLLAAELSLTLLANRFLGHPGNDELRRRASPACTDEDRISADLLYRQLLILVYRFLFLLVTEDRGVLSANPSYREHYGAARLRRMLDHRTAFTDHDDLWQSLRVVWLLLANDQPQPSFHNQPMASALGLPVLNGDLFAGQSLDGFTLTNRDLLDAFWRLAWLGVALPLLGHQTLSAWVSPRILRSDQAMRIRRLSNRRRASSRQRQRSR
jgi:hypothetical protein